VTATSISTTLSTPAAAGPVGILGLDHLEFYVGNPRHAAHFYRTTFGLQPTGFASLETGLADRCSFLLTTGDVRFVVTGAMQPESEVGRHVNAHGDTVRDIALAVEDVESAYHEALKRGARSVQEPTAYRSGDRTLKRAAIGATGDIIHSLVERDSSEWFLPGFSPLAGSRPDRCISSIDHLAVSLRQGTLDEMVDFYTRVLGFHESHEEYVISEYSAMNSKVVQSADGSIRLPLLEPAPGKRKSQVEEFLDFHGGPGVQHAALVSDNIIQTVAGLRAKGVDFLNTPSTYYETLVDRVGDLEEDVVALRDLNILVDRDPWGYLMQIFSAPLQSRPTFFVEVIQRKGARGFGSGNIKALFEAVEREQRRRGTL
jgi:4-hydroxyphenylpyruvate dioxygenase